MRRFPIPALPGSEPTELPAEVSHHVVRVCRMGPGDRLVLFDGRGQEVEVAILALSDGLATVRAATAPRSVPAPDPVHLVLGLPKGPATDDALRMATEAGAAGLHLVWADRTQGRPDRTDRWSRIVTSAAAQCGRADVPALHGPGSLQDTLARLDGMDLFVALPASGSTEPVLRGPRAVFIGPAGGWSPSEVDRLLDAGARALELGPWVLRSATAAAIAVATLVR